MRRSAPRRFSYQWVLLFMVAALALVGCGRTDLVPARGQVLLDGEPLGRATVTLLPQAEGGRPAVALSLADGSFELQTNNYRGAKPGQYKALVAKDEPAPNSPESSPPSDPPAAPRLIGQADRAELESGMQRLTRFAVRSLIPERYSSPATSPLECEIPTVGTRSLRLELRSQ